MKLQRIFGLTLVALTLSFGVGCKSSSKLEPGGAYAPARPVVENGQTNMVATAAPDKGFFVADAAFDLAYATVNAAFQFERDNRAWLFQVSPDIKHSLDKIRPEAVNVAKTYGEVREAYERNPTPAGLTQLQTILGQMQRLTVAAQAALPHN